MADCNSNIQFLLSLNMRPTKGDLLFHFVKLP